MTTLKRVDCGYQHHFIGECRFHLATFINNILISTVGDYRPSGRRDTIGAHRYYETYVFKTDNEWKEVHIASDGIVDSYAHPDVIDFCEIDSLPAQTMTEASVNHEKMVADWGDKILVADWETKVKDDPRLAEGWILP